MSKHTTPRSLIIGFMILFVAFFINESKATWGTAIANGNWNAAGTWDMGRAPGNSDSLIIPDGVIVTVNINSPTYTNMAILVYGTLNFDVGQKIKFCPGCLLVMEGGQLTGGNGGSKIEYCGSPEWVGPGPTAGPEYYGDYAGGSYTNTVYNLRTATDADNKASATSIGARWSPMVVQNGDYFLVERSENGLTFEEIGRVEGKGFSTSREEYTFIDEHPLDVPAYYRVIQKNDKGYSETSRNIYVENIASNKGCALKVLPNPCVDDCTVNFTDCPGDNDGVINVEMIDANGTVVSSQVAEQDANGAFSMQVDRSNNLKPGMYIVRGSSAKNVYVQKAVLK